VQPSPESGGQLPPSQELPRMLLQAVMPIRILTHLGVGRVADPDPDPDWIRIRMGSGFNRVSGSGSRRAKMTHKSRKNFLSSCFEVLDGLF
jgi:hypothetical protein